MSARFALLALGALGWTFVVLAACQSHPKTTPEQYRVYCTRCHGPRGEGDPKTLKRYPAADLRASTMMARSDRVALRRRIAQGYGPMPAFSHYLAPVEIERMVDYVLRLRATQRKGP